MPQTLHRLSLLESIIGAVNLGAIVLDDNRSILLWNRWLERHSGWQADTVLGRDFFEVFPELQHKRIESAITQALRDNFQSLLSQSLHKAPFPLYQQAAAGSERRERMQQAVAVTPISLPGTPRHCLIQITDVTIAVGREKLLREQTMVLRSQTFSDGLTGVANRRHFDVAIDKEMRRARRSGSPLSLLMIDIDHFKDYNDQYGHQQGDTCLKQVAGALAAMLNRSGDVLARYGGEEFAAILPDTELSKALGLAEAIRKGVRALAIDNGQQDGAPRPITISIGVASHSAGAPLEMGQLIGAADRALYRAKDGGRNQVISNDSPPTPPA
ncbi:diguanylate cyclase [Janthinobacterium sp. PC23-8]|uniref:diguanylate cyclase n=1 Tax=Janthinobacterium sp. PC23-8 TaxID=2012679 RepID=UPI000B979883|nr:diguanylate cyclase [Janthinobacterium sp. PC23-8]OYO32413.1 diguanylate cyclase [Janthinobacterium sp. PC23-8]